MPRLLIVGGDDAGISAALRARELAPDWESRSLSPTPIQISAFAAFPMSVGT